MPLMHITEDIEGYIEVCQRYYWYCHYATLLMPYRLLRLSHYWPASGFAIDWHYASRWYWLLITISMAAIFRRLQLFRHYWYYHWYYCHIIAISLFHDIDIDDIAFAADYCCFHYAFIDIERHYWLPLITPLFWLITPLLIIIDYYYIDAITLLLMPLIDTPLPLLLLRWWHYYAISCHYQTTFNNIETLTLLSNSFLTEPLHTFITHISSD
jgi:hypothetical protein